MGNDGLDARRGAWDRYWATGALHSCAGSYDANYGGGVAAFWKTVFAPLNAGHHVLDLATGNGPIPALLAALKPPPGLPEVLGVDLATPSPEWLDAAPGTVRARIRIQGGVDLGTLPLPDTSIDLVTSQYGFEYADRAAATREVLRVLKPTSRVAMILHHSASRLVEVAHAEVTHLDWVLAKGPVLEATRAMLPYVALSGRPGGPELLRGNAQAEGARQAFNAAMSDLSGRARAAAIPDALQDVEAFLPQLMRYTAQQGEQAGSAWLDATLSAMEAARLRSAELLRFALDHDAIETLAGSFRSTGFQVEAVPVEDSGHLMGWGMVATRG